jgi:hypothetical protein
MSNQRGSWLDREKWSLGRDLNRQPADCELSHFYQFRLFFTTWSPATFGVIQDCSALKLATLFSCAALAVVRWSDEFIANPAKVLERADY